MSKRTKYNRPDRFSWAPVLLLVLGTYTGPALGVGYEPGDLPIAHPNASQIERVTIPAGDFLMGNSSGSNADQGPAHSVYLDTYEIGTYEVTWEQFQAFIDAGGYENKAFNGYWSRWGVEISEVRLWVIDEVGGKTLDAPKWTTSGAGPPGFASKDRWPPRPNDPVVGISVWEAEAFCRFVGGRLPTEAEWEKAASWGPNATDGIQYPWGDSATVPLPSNAFEVSEGGSSIQTVDDPSYEGDVTLYGIRGMGGNVTEWVADMYDPEYYGQGPGVDSAWRNPFNFMAKRFDYTDEIRPNFPLGWVMRGANFMNVSQTSEEFECARRQSEQQFHRNRTLGFRVAWDGTPKRDDPPLVEREDRPGAAVPIPSGSYLIGHSRGMPGAGFEVAAHPQHPVCLTDYWIGKYEVTWYEYRKYMELGGYGDPLGPKPDWWSEEGWKWRTLPPCAGNDVAYAAEHGLSVEEPAFVGSERPQFPDGRTVWKGPWSERDGMSSPPDDHPVFGISWYEAEAYCNFVGGRLPLEAEWEVAASWNPETQKPMQYPWGNLYLHPFDTALANSGDDPRYEGFQSSPVGMYSEGRSPFGCYDMAGNIIEWCEDWSNAESYAHHSPECGVRPMTPESMKLDFTSLLCDPNYWPVPGIKSNRGGGYDPSFLNSPAQGSRTRVGNIGDGYMLFRNYTYGLRVAWDQDPNGMREAERTRPAYKNGKGSPSASSRSKSSKGRPKATSLKATSAVLKSAPITFNGAIDSPGKNDWYRVSGPQGLLATIDLDANAGADDLTGTSPLDAVVEVWHDGIDVPVKVRDDEVVPTSDESFRYSYFDPPVFQHRIPEEGFFFVKVRAYSWPAEGSQAGLTEGERSYNGPEYAYQLAITAPEVTESDPSGDGMLTAQDLLAVLEGFSAKSSKRIHSDLTGDGSLNAMDLFQANRMWLNIGNKTGQSIDNF